MAPLPFWLARAPWDCNPGSVGARGCPRGVQEKGKGCSEPLRVGLPELPALPERRPRLCQKLAFLEGRGWGESVNEKLGAERARGRGRCQERAAGAGAAPAGRPGCLWSRFCFSVRFRRSRPLLEARPRPPAAPPSPSARSLSLLRVVTKHYKKTGRAVPGIGGRGAAAAYILASAASAAAPTRTPRAAAATPALHASRPPSSRRGPSPRPAPSTPGTAKPAGRKRKGPLWTSRQPTSGRSAGHRWAPRRHLALGTVGGAAPRPETSVQDQPPGMR